MESGQCETIGDDEDDHDDEDGDCSVVIQSYWISDLPKQTSNAGSEQQKNNHIKRKPGGCHPKTCPGDTHKLSDGGEPGHIQCLHSFGQAWRSNMIKVYMFLKAQMCKDTKGRMSILFPEDLPVPVSPLLQYVQEGEDGNCGSSAVADTMCLQEYDLLIPTLTYPKVEEAVKRRVDIKAKNFQTGGDCKI